MAVAEAAAKDAVAEAAPAVQAPLELLASHIITVVGLAFMVSGGAMTWLNKMGH